ncbi:MAG: glycosyltransferase [Marinilabiliaceae bacterium]|jgi:cellulose synthase/poly-beta-1,6-N-acetylglucosamine synthase-like glycosyltransferase|nr:glycosyltransferase [Marinilabiliaceae bacterium]
MLLFVLVLLPYILLISYAIFGLLKPGLKYCTVNSPETDLQLPFVSVIVAARNEEDCLPALINDLQQQGYPSGNYEIIIVDDNSTDRTPRIIKESEGVLYLHSDGRGKKHAISMGLDHAGGELILTTDADCRLDPDWILTLALCYNRFSPALIIGSVDPAGGKSIFSKLLELEFASLQAVTIGMAAAGRPLMCNGANLAFRKSLSTRYLEQTKSKLLSGDDVFLLHHAKKSGGTIIVTDQAEATVKTRMPGSVFQFFRQRARWTSKSFHYSDTDTIISALATALANFAIVAAFITAIIIPGFRILLILLYILKLIPDIILLAVYLKRKRKINLLGCFLPLSVIYPFYIVLTFLISLLRRPIW